MRSQRRDVLYVQPLRREGASARTQVAAITAFFETFCAGLSSQPSEVMDSSASAPTLGAAPKHLSSALVLALACKQKQQAKTASAAPPAAQKQELQQRQRLCSSVSGHCSWQPTAIEVFCHMQACRRSRQKSWTPAHQHPPQRHPRSTSRPRSRVPLLASKSSKLKPRVPRRP